MVVFMQNIEIQTNLKQTSASTYDWHRLEWTLAPASWVHHQTEPARRCRTADDQRGGREWWHQTWPVHSRAGSCRQQPETRWEGCSGVAHLHLASGSSALSTTKHLHARRQQKLIFNTSKNWWILVSQKWSMYQDKTAGHILTQRHMIKDFQADKFVLIKLACRHTLSSKDFRQIPKIQYIHAL